MHDILQPSSKPNLAYDIEKLKEVHTSHYSISPDVVCVSPVCINLMGEHSWFFKDKMLSLPTSMNVLAGVSRNKQTNDFRFFFFQMNDEKKCALKAVRFKKEDKWANQIKAVLKVFQSFDIAIPALDFTIYSVLLPNDPIDIIPAIRAAVLLAVDELIGATQNHDILKYAGVKEGTKNKNKILSSLVPKMCIDFLKEKYIASQNFSAMFSLEGSLIVTDCSKNIYQNIALDTEGYSMFLVCLKGPKVRLWNSSALMTAQNALVLGDLKEDKKDVFGGWIYKKQSRQLKDVLLQADSASCEQLLCIMNEHDYILQAIRAISCNDMSAFLKAVNQSCKNIYDLYDLVCPEVEWLVKRIYELDSKRDLQHPITCVHIIGKSSSKTLFCMLPYDKVSTFKEKLVEYEKIFGSKCNIYQIQTQGATRVAK